MDAAAAWDVVWQKGTGRGPWQGGTLEGYELSYAIGIRYEFVQLKEGGYWAPRQASQKEVDSADEWEDIAAGDCARLPEHEWFAVLGRAGEIPEDYGRVDRLRRKIDQRLGRETETETDSEEESEEPRELSPAEPGRMEERGFMTWASPGITVGEN